MTTTERELLRAAVIAKVRADRGLKRIRELIHMRNSNTQCNEDLQGVGAKIVKTNQPTHAK